MNLTKIKEKVNKHKETIFLFLVIFLACLLSFSLGWLFCKFNYSKDLEFKHESSIPYWNNNGWQSQVG